MKHLKLYEKFHINQIVLDITNLAFEKIKKNPDKKLYNIKYKNLEFVIKTDEKNNGFSAWETQLIKKFSIHIRYTADNDLVLKRFLSHEINHAIDWWYINKDAFNSNSFIFKPLGKDFKSINKIHKLNGEEIKSSPLHYIIYVLSDSEMKSRLHEFYFLIEKDINKQKSNEDIKKIFQNKLKTFKSINYEFIKDQLKIIKELIPGDFNENTIIYLGKSRKKYLIGLEISQFFNKEHINKNDFYKLEKYLNKRLDILKSKIIKMMSLFL